MSFKGFIKTVFQSNVSHSGAGNGPVLNHREVNKLSDGVEAALGLESIDHLRATGIPTSILSYRVMPSGLFYHWIPTSTQDDDGVNCINPDRESEGAGRFVAFAGFISPGVFASLQDACDYSAEHGQPILLNGCYEIQDTLRINGLCALYSPAKRLARIKYTGLGLAVAVGNESIFEGSLSGFIVERASYSVGSVGICFFDCSDVVVSDVESRFSEVNITTNPALGQRVGYSSFYNVGGVGGRMNIDWGKDSGGWVNENTFNSGRNFTTSNTETNIVIDGNHNRFITPSAEGTGDQAILIKGHSNLVFHPRTEGAWANDSVVIDETSLRATVIASTLYTSVEDLGIDSNIQTVSSGNKWSSGLGGVVVGAFKGDGARQGKPVVSITDNSSTPGEGKGLEVTLNRDDSDSRSILAQRSDGLERFYVSANGGVFAGRSLHVGQSGWNFNPLRIGGYYLWVHNHKLYMKHGVPSGEADGALVSSQS